VEWAVKNKDVIDGWKHAIEGVTVASIAKPDKETVSWNPKEYEVTSIDLEKGVIVFKLIDA
jgi:hypothetical protein